MRYIFFNIKKLIILFILSTFIISLSLPIKKIKAQEIKIIKFGYTPIEGFTEVVDSAYTGYAFEYLFEIAKHAGWKYEFIELSLSDALDKLKNGEIDLVAGMIKNEKSVEIFDFPELNSGYTYSILATLKDSDHISRSNFTTLNGLRIGYFDRSESKLSKLNDFFESKDISNVTYKSYPYTDDKALINALNNNEVDAIITGDLLLNSGMKVLSKFDSLPYYFATTKGNTEIIEDLDYAINKINEQDPTFSDDLYFKHFEYKLDTSIVFTEEELNFLNNMKSFKAIYIDNFKPIQYHDKFTNGPKGIIVDIGKLISSKLGIPLELIEAKNYDEAYKLIEDNPDYIAIGVPVTYYTSKTKNVVFTKSYLDFDIVKAYSKKEPSNKEDQILALPYGYGYYELNSGYKIEYYDTLEDCLNAVEKNKASLTYGNYHTISSYITDGYFSNLSVVPDSHSIPASCAMSVNVDKTYFDIINKVITSISPTDIKSIIYNNSTDFKSSVTFKSFFLSNLNLFLTLIAVILIIIASLIGVIVRLKFNDLKRKKDLLLSKSQTDQLTGLYNRSTCEELVINYLKERNSSLYYAFIILDIDHFKQINDKFGHQTGDKLLQEFSNFLKKSFTNKDIVCRLGGDEFIIFMKDINKDNINIVDKKLQKICKEMNKEVEQNGTTQGISISAGAIVTNEYIDFNHLYYEADEALYYIKRNGRNGYKIS